MTKHQIFDTYYHLLESKGIHDFGLTALKIRHSTPDFNKDHYESQTKTSFQSRNEAYEHWVKFGRRNGLEYTPGKNTKLKIILKAKDEPELIDKWIQHHGEMVGLHNIIILDCNSEDRQYLEKLNEYSHHVLVIKYPRYYDHIHNTEANKSFFSLISENSRYAAVLDADEFLIWKDAQDISRSYPGKLLSEDTEIFCGTWLHNSRPPTQSNAEIDWNDPLNFRMTDSDIRSGTIAGKSIIRSDLLFKARHLGHNLHVKEVKDLTTPESFGKFLILHISDLGKEITKKRCLQHLISKKVITKADLSSVALPEKLARLVDDQSIHPSIRNYARKILLHNSNNPSKEADTFATGILNSATREPQSELVKKIDRFDFSFNKTP